MEHDTTANWRIVCLLALGAFLGLAVAAFATGLLPGDIAVRQELLEPDASLAHRLARVFNEGGTWHVLLPAALLLYLLSRAARRHWWLWASIMVGSSLLEHGFKFLVGRPRPSGLSLGFPSGHSTAAASFAVLLIYLASREPLPRARRLAVQALAIAAMALVGWARIVLHAHWPTDVLGGFLLGTGCAAAGAWWESSRPDAAGAVTARRGPSRDSHASRS
jgi:membrane-associated phospholipid phosphatase